MSVFAFISPVTAFGVLFTSILIPVLLIVYVVEKLKKIKVNSVTLKFPRSNSEVEGLFIYIMHRYRTQ